MRKTNEINRNYFSKIIKRDGREIEFDKNKIKNAIAKANKVTLEIEEKEMEKVLNLVMSLLRGKNPSDIVNIEEVQDCVEVSLMRLGYEQTSKSYILYRTQHAEMRSLAIASSLGIIDNYLDESDWQVKENSNMTLLS